jgi:transposase
MYLNGKVHVYSAPVDMRKSYDSLSGLVYKSHNVLSGDIFLFISRDLKKAKALYWDGTGLNIWMKRLSKGCFAKIYNRHEISVSELGLFFEGSKKVVEKLSPSSLKNIRM